MSVAQTILAQLGGRKFMVMTGAKNLVDHGQALSFKLPSNFAKDGVNYVKIDLTPADEYRVKFSRVRGMRETLVHEVDGIYCDMLQRLFTNITGLDTHM